MEAAWSTETMVTYHITTRHRNREDGELNLHRRENLKFCNSNGIKMKSFSLLEEEINTFEFFSHTNGFRHGNLDSRYVLRRCLFYFLN